MAKTYTEVLPNSENVFVTTNGNDIINIPNDETLTNKTFTVKASKGSDILFIKNVSSTNQIESVTQVADSTSLKIKITDGREIIIENYFTTLEGKATKSSVKTLRLDTANTSEIDLNTLIQYSDPATFIPNNKGVVNGTVFSDVMNFGNYSEMKLTFNANDGNDTVTGGKLNDTFVGGKGDNVYIYNAGSGQDTIKLTKGENLIIKYVGEKAENEAYSLSDFTIEEVKKDVVISRTYKNAHGIEVTDKITIKDMTKNNVAESVKFYSGTTADNAEKIADIRKHYFDIVGTKTSIAGTNLNERIFGTQGNDTIKGNGGDDVIYGNLGNDKLYGGAGEDAFVFETYTKENPITGDIEYFGAGNDTIFDATNEDTLRFTSSNVEDIKFEMAKNKKDLVVTYYDKSDSKGTTETNTVTIKNYYSQTEAKRIDKFVALDVDGVLTTYRISGLTDEARAEIRQARNAKEEEKRQAEAAAQEKMRELTEQLNAAKGEYDTIYENLKTAQAENEQLVTELNEAIARNEETQAELSIATTNYNNKLEEIESFGTLISSYENNLVLAQETYENAQAELTQAQQDKQASEEALSVYILEHKTVVDELNAKEQAKEQAETAYQEALNDPDKTEDEINILNQAKEQAEADLESAKEENAEVVAALEELRNADDEKAEALATAQDNKDQAENAVTRLTTEKTAIENDLQEAQEILPELETILNTARDNNNDALSALEQARAEKQASDDTIAQIMVDYQAALDKYEEIKAYKDKLEGGLASILEIIDDLKNEIEGLIEANEALKSESAEKTAQITELTGRVADMNAEIAQLTADKEEITAQVEELTSTIEQNMAEIAQLNEDKESLADQVESLTGTIDEKTAQITQLTSDKDALTSQIEELTLTIEQDNAYITQLEQTKESLNTQVGELNAAIQEKTAQLAELEASIETEIAQAVADKEAEIAQLNEDKEALADQIEALTGTIDEKTAQITQLTSDKDALTAQVGELTTTIEQKTSEITQLTSDKDALTTQIGELTSTIEQNTATIEQLNADKEELNGTIETLTNEKAELQNQVDNFWAIIAEEKANNTHTYTVATNGEAFTLTPFGESATDDVIKLTKSDFEECKLTNNGNDLVIQYFNNVDNNNTSGQLTIKDYFNTTMNERTYTVVDKDGNTYSLNGMVKAFNGTDGNDTINIIAKNSTISGNAGNDTISVDGNNNVFTFKSGDGKDVVTANHGENTTLKFTDSKFEDLTFGRVNGTDDLMVYHNKNKDSVRLTNWFSDANKVNTLVDSTGTTYTISADAEYNNHTFGSDNDYLITVPQRVVKAGLGNDTIYVVGDHNVAEGDSGIEAIYVYGDCNTVSSGENINSSSSNPSYENIYLQKGSSKTTINFSGNEGYYSSSSYYGYYYNYDNIYSGGTSYADGRDSVLKITDRIFNDLSFSKSGADLLITVAYYSRVIIKDYFIYNNTLDTIEDMNGNTYSISEKVSSLGLDKSATTSADYIKVTGNMTVDAQSGADNINVYGDWNTITGEAGDDIIYLREGSSRTTINYTSGHGSDTIYSGGTSYADGTNSVLRFTDKKFEDMVCTKSGDDLVIQYGSTTDKVTLKYWFKYNNTLETIKDSTNTIYTREDIISNLGTSTSRYFKVMGAGDTVSTSDGDDVVCIRGTNNTVSSNKGKDSIKVYDKNNIISGGKDNDNIYLYKGASRTTLKFASGDGSDNVYSGGTSYANGVNSALQFTNTTFANLSFTKSGNDLVITYGSDKVTLSGYFACDNAIDKIIDSAGNEYSISDKVAALGLDKSLSSTVKVTGDMNVTASGTNTTFQIFGANNTLTGYSYSGYIGSISSSTVDNFYIYGTNNIVDGKMGNDTIYLQKGSSNTTIKYRFGDYGTNSYPYSNKDVIYSGGTSYGDGTDSVLHITDVTFSSLTFAKNGTDLIITNNNSSYYTSYDSITLKDWFKYDNVINTIKDSSGNNYSISDKITALGLDKPATSGDDLIKLTGNTTINSLGGADTIYVNGSGNVVSTGYGDDTIYLQKSATNTVINVSGNDNRDTIYSGGTLYGGEDTVIKFNDTDFDDMAFSANNSDLVILYNGTSNKVTLKDWYKYNNVVNKIKDSSGTEYTLSDIVNDASISADKIKVTSNKTVNALAGNDSIYVNGANNIVSGNTGDDDIYLLNGSSNTTIKFASGDGVDTIYCGGTSYADGTDSILNFTNISFNELSFVKDGTNLLISKDDDTVKLVDWFSYGNVINTIKDKNNGTYSISDKVAELGINIIKKQYRDFINVTENNQNINAESGTGIIEISGNNNTVTGNDGIDYIYVNGGTNNTVNGAEGTDYIYMNSSNNTASGGAGTDYFYVRGENNKVSGDAGNDYVYLDKGSSETTIKFGTDFGNDTVYSGGTSYGDGTDSVLHFTNAQMDSLSFIRNGANLVINSVNDKVTLMDWFKYNNVIDTIKDSTGNTYSISEKVNEIKLNENGTASDDILKVSDNMNVWAQAGNDTIYVYGSNNSISGDANNDIIYLQKGSSNNTINFSATGSSAVNNSDTIYSGGTEYADGSDSVLYFTDVEYSNLSFTSSGSNLVISYGSYNKVTIADWYKYDNTLDIIKDKNGDTYSLSKIAKELGLYGTPTTNADVIKVTPQDVLVAGGEGDNYIDIQSNDKVTLSFTSGDGNDTVNSNNNNSIYNVLKFTDVERGDMTFSADGNNLKITYTDNDSVTLNDWFTQENSIKNLNDSTNTTSDLSQLQSDVMSWMEAHTGYANVSEAIANNGTDASVASLIAIFDNFNNV